MNTTNEVTTQAEQWVEITRITVPGRVRTHTPEDVDSRAASMSKEGQLQNILLSKEGEQLVLVYGNGRLESAKKLGWEKIRADVKEGLTETQKLLMTLAENDERENASPFYTASLYQRLMAIGNLDQTGLAKELGKDPTLVMKYMSLTKADPEVQQHLNRFRLGLRQCLEIAKLSKPEDQVQLAQECAEKDYSVRELQARVKQVQGKPVEAKPVTPKAAPAFQCKWKGRELQIKVRPFRPDQEQWSSYEIELEDAVNRYRAAFPLAEEASAAA